MPILLKNPDRCPACGTRDSIRWDQHRCAECNVPIFHTTDNFAAMKRDWVLAYWVWFGMDSASSYRGWVHSTHLQDGTPNDPDYTVANPGENYGKTDVVQGSQKRRVI